MKKIMFLQILGKSYGGVWQVNKTVGEELLKHNFDVSIICLRNNQNNLLIEHDPKLKVKTINEVDPWGTYSGTEILNTIKTRGKNAIWLWKTRNRRYYFG